MQNANDITNVKVTFVCLLSSFLFDAVIIYYDNQNATTLTKKLFDTRSKQAYKHSMTFLTKENKQGGRRE